MRIPLWTLCTLLITVPVGTASGDTSEEATTGIERQTWARPGPVARAPQPADRLVAPDRSTPVLLSLDNDPEGDMPRDVAFTPDGLEVVVANRDTDYLMFFDWATRTVTHSVVVGDFPVDVEVTPDGRYAITANVFSDDVSIVDVATHTLVANVPISGIQPYALAVTPDSAYVVVGVVNDAVSSQFSIIDLNTLTETQTFPSTPQGVFGWFFTPNYDIFGNIFTEFALTPDGSKIVLPDRGSSQVVLYDRVTGAQLAALPTAGLPTAVDVSSDSSLAVVSHEGSEKKISVVDILGLTVSSVLDTVNNLGNQIVRITPDKTHAVAAISNNVIFVNIASNTVTSTLSTGTVGDIELSHDGNYYYVSNYNSRIISIATQSVVKTMTLAACADSATSPVTPAAVGLNNRFGEKVQFYSTNGSGAAALGATNSGPAPEGDVPNQVAIAPGGAVGAVSNQLSDNVCILDLAGQSVRSYVDTGERGLDAAITPDGLWLVVANGDDDSISVIDLTTDTEVAHLPMNTRPARLLVSPDGTKAYATTVAGTDRVYFISLAGAASSVTGSLVAGQMGSANGYSYSEVSGMALSPDGSILAVCISFDDELLLIDTATQSQLTRVTVGDFPIRVSFSADGSRAYVINAFGDDVWGIDINGAASSVAGSVGGIDFPSTIDVDPSGAFAYVGSYSSSANALYVIDTTSFSIVASLPLSGARVRDARLDGVESILYLASVFTDHFQLMRVQAAGAATALIDLEDLDGNPGELELDRGTNRVLISLPGVDAVNLADFPSDTYRAVCFGDVPGICRCGNEVPPGTEEGCINSTGVGGKMWATGSNVVANDDLVLHVSQCRASEFALILQGSSTTGIPFKDGHLCVGAPTERIQFLQLDPNGEGSSTVSIATKGNVTPGTTNTYQLWFRDGWGLSVCGLDSNTTHAVEIDWQ